MVAEKAHEVTLLISVSDKVCCQLFITEEFSTAFNTPADHPRMETDMITD